MLQNPFRTKGRTYALSYWSIVCPGPLHSPSAEEHCLISNVASLRYVKVATPLCAAKAAVPCGFAATKRF